MHTHFIEARPLPPTNSQPARVKLTSHRFEKGRIIGYTPDGPVYARELAEQALEAMGYTIVCTFETKEGFGFTVCEFLPLAEATPEATARWRERS